MLFVTIENATIYGSGPEI